MARWHLAVGIAALLAVSALGAADVRIVPPDGEAAQYWPRWRGPSGQGVVPDGAYPDKWSDSDNVLWKVPVAGDGNSSPIIWKNSLLLTTAYEQGKRRSIVCFDRSNGKQLWESFVPEGKPEKVKDKNGWASGTAATDGERVYAYFGNYGLYCCDMDGKKVWHEVFGDMDAYHGMSCSPLLYKDRVIVFQDHRSAFGSFAVALDKKTGKQLWKTPRKEKVGWGSPVAISVDGKDQIIVSSESRVYSYDPESGKELWSCTGNLVEVTPTPVVGQGMIFCCSGRAGPTLAIQPDGAGDVTKTHLKWRSIKGSPFIPSPLLYGEYLYMVDDIVSAITCFEAKSGKLMWRERCGEVVKHGFSASPIGVNGKVFFTNDDGETFVLAAGPEFKLLHMNRMNEKTLASPALLDGKWYMRTQRHLYCVGAK